MKDVNALKDDMMELKPTFLAGVPRVLERIHEGDTLVDIKLLTVFIQMFNFLFIFSFLFCILSFRK